MKKAPIGTAPEGGEMTMPHQQPTPTLMPHSDEIPLLVYLSMGWGIQSWTLAAMIALGELPPIDLAIHADTGHEAQGTYEHAQKWTPWLEQRGLPVETIHPENNQVIREGWCTTGSIQIPAFTLDKLTAQHGSINRQCTKHYGLFTFRPESEGRHAT